MDMSSTNDPVTDLKEYVEELKENLDHIYLLTNAIFVCLMQCGFACLEAGSIRVKNVTNIMMKNILDIFISCLAYWLIGYAVAYGKGNPYIGLTYWAGVGLPKDKYSHWIFQFVFAATAATIVSGAVAERCNFVAYIVYSAIISGFIYPVVSHWVWSENGWLSNMGYSDFAGSGAVHLLAGTCSLTATVLLGPRIGRFEGVEMPGHSIPLVAIGGFVLITGFLAFNGGSLGNMTARGAGTTISVVIANTFIGGTGGAASALMAGKSGLTGPKSWNFCLTLNGALTGMVNPLIQPLRQISDVPVSVCAAADEFQFWSSFVVGTAAGFVYLGFHYIIPLWKVDDPLDAVAVHFGGGLWGILAGPLFKEGGIIYGLHKENLLGLMYNIIGALAITVWSGVTSIFLFGGLKWSNYLRVSREEELKGLDISKHKEPAYPSAAWCDKLDLLHNKSCVSDDSNVHGSDMKVRNVQEYSNHSFQGDHL